MLTFSLYNNSKKQCNSYPGSFPNARHSLKNDSFISFGCEYFYMFIHIINIYKDNFILYYLLLVCIMWLSKCVINLLIVYFFYYYIHIYKRISWLLCLGNSTMSSESSYSLNRCTTFCSRYWQLPFFIF